MRGKIAVRPGLCKQRHSLCKDGLSSCKQRHGLCKDGLSLCKQRHSLCKDRLNSCKQRLSSCKDRLNSCNHGLNPCKDGPNLCKDGLSPCKGYSSYCTIPGGKGSEYSIGRKEQSKEKDRSAIDCSTLFRFCTGYYSCCWRKSVVWEQPVWCWYYEYDKQD